MGLFNKFKRKQPVFIHDDKYDEFHAELKGIKFVCEKAEDNYERLAEELSNAYESKLPDIVNFLLPEINEMFGISDIDVIQKSLGKPQIDLDKSMIVYCEQTLDDIHIISVEFGGLFTDFYYASIDG
ncbi:hypothetical protein [Mediterraneibacter sp. ICN-202921]|uniref:hypothetical protein n=1 Tax=Mediterraneibacter sp. ICN-202921 TaxID=3134657 RepID=UPI000E54B40F|nr:hypothetical protein DWX08_06170 [Ruminococcus sp. AF18-22]